MDSELTTGNVNDTLTIAPETTAVAEAPTDSIYDDVGESLGLDATPEFDESDDPFADAPQAEGEASPDSSAADAAEIEELRRLKAEVEAERAARAEWEAQRQQQENARYWAGRDQQAIAAYKTREQQIYQQAAYQYDPAAYIAHHMQQLNNEHLQWQVSERAFRENVISYAHAQALVPQYAEQVASHFGLGPEGSAELMRMYRSREITDPDQMPREARRLAEIHRLRGQVDQAKRSAAASRVSSNGVGPGSGHASGVRIRPGAEIKSGSNQSRWLLQRLLSS